MATLSAVYDGTLELLGIIELGQTALSADTARMVRAYDQVYADLQKEGLAAWSQLYDVPDEFVPHVEALMAMNATESYHVGQERYQRIVLKSSAAKREIRRLSLPDYESVDEPVDY